MKAIEKAKAHFDSLEIKTIEVPEWGDEDNPLIIHAKPITLQETSKLYKMAKDDDLAMMSYVLIYKALDENGDKLFDLGDKSTLLNSVDRDVLVRVATVIMGNDNPDILKKS